MRRTWLLWLVVLQALFLLGMAGSAYATSWFGQEIKLRTVPVDPRDVFYGDYVTLAYPMSRADAKLWRGTNGLPERGDAVYTLLVRKGEFYEPEGVYPKRIETGPDEVMIKGRVEFAYGEEMWITYGLERYYIPQNTGRELEEASDRLAVRVKIAPWGQHQISGVEFISAK